MSTTSLETLLDTLGPHAKKLGDELLVAIKNEQYATITILAVAVLDVVFREPCGAASLADGRDYNRARYNFNVRWLRKRRNSIVHYEGFREGFLDNKDDEAILKKDADRALEILTEALTTLIH